MTFSRLRHIVIALGTVLLLTFLFVKTQTIGFVQHERFVGDLRQLQKLDATLNQEGQEKDRGNVTQADFGRFNVTGDEEDRYRFKVCSLRNVTLTPPYFHDGSAQTLEEAIAVMARYQLGRRLAPEEIDLMVKFLRTLTGVYKEKPLDTYSQ